MGLFDKLKDMAGELSQGYSLDNYIPSKFKNPATPPPFPQEPTPQAVQSAPSGPASQAAPAETGASLYDPQLERLIELAIADGVITDKERRVLFNKAAQFGIDPDEFEMVLEGRLYERNKAAAPVSAPASAAAPVAPSQPVNTAPPAPAPVSNKHGNAKKCPVCGAIVQSMSLTCVECGHEFRNVEANQGIQRLFELLVEAEKPTADPSSNSFGGIINNILSMTSEAEKISQRKKTIIRNYPIPTAKEDIIEFLALAAPRAKVSFWSDDSEAREMAPIWKAKCQEIIIKAQFSMRDDPATLAQIQEYAKMLKIKF